MTKSLYISGFVFILLLTGILFFLFKGDMGIGQTCSENLYQAVESGDSAKVESFLIQDGCSVIEITKTGFSPLTLAASKNDLATLEILLRDLDKSELLKRDSFSRNPLDYAIRVVDPEVWRLYLDIFPGMLSWQDGEEYLYEKILKNSPRVEFDGPMKDILILLEENDPKERFYHKGRDIILEKAAEMDIGIRSQWIDFFLFEAWKSGDLKKIADLIEQGADPFVPYEGKSVYDRVIKQKDAIAFLTLVKLTTADLDRLDKSGQNLLEKTIEANFLKGVKTLVKNNIDPNATSNTGEYPLYAAVKNSLSTGKFEMVDYLMTQKPVAGALNQVRKKLWSHCDGKKWIPKNLLITFYGKDYWQGSKTITQGFETLLSGLPAKSLVICDDLGCDPGQLKKIALSKTSGISMEYEIEGKEYVFNFQSLARESVRLGGFEYKSGQTVRVGKLTGMALLDIPNSTVGTIFKKEGKDHLKLVTINITGKGATTICIPLTKVTLPVVMDKVHKMKLWQLLMEYYAFKEG